MEILHLAVGPLQVNCYVLGCTETAQALVVDPGEDAADILTLLKSKGWSLKQIVSTHGHFDHVGGNRALVEQTGASLAMHRADLPLAQGADQHAGKYGLRAEASPVPDRFLEDGDQIQVGSIELEVIHTPGHSPGGICLYDKSGHLFVGDTLFADSVGRTDLPGGSHSQLVQSIRTRLMDLPGETIVYPGHGPETTVAREKAHNPFVGQGT